MTNFWKRALTGAIFVLVMLGGMMYNYWTMCALFFVIAILGLNEFYILIKKHSAIYPQRWFGMAIGAIMFLLFVFRYQFSSELIFTMMIPMFIAIFLCELYRKKDAPFLNIAITILGIIYIALPFGLWVNYLCPYSTTHNDFLDLMLNTFLPAKGYNPNVLLGYFFILWSNDTGAYLTGSLIGKHALWERISPKKTWEGFIGGILISLAVAYFISHYFTELNLLLWLTTSVAISIFGTLGDMVESMFKRSIDVKDSGGLLPGHGGILDRFDGVLLSTPIVLAIIHISALISAMPT